MKAIVLVGGEGTRLRPLTETVPKPLLPMMNRAFLHRMLDHLGEHGVHEVVLSSSYLESAFQEFLEERHGDPKVTWITEAVPLGTGGAIVNALPNVDDTFLVLNGDILTDLDLSAMVAFHSGHGAVATISLAHVSDARPYGLVPTRDGRVMEFREKPAELVPGDVNSGTYVLEPEALEGWEAQHMISVEREVFPRLISSGAPVFGFLSDAYWMDLGTPEKYLQAHFDILEGKLRGIRVPATHRADAAGVDLRAHLGRWVVLGAGVTVGPNAEIDDSVLHAGVSVEPGARVFRSILGPGVVIGARAVVTGSVLAEGARVEDDAQVTDARVSAGQVAGLEPMSERPIGPA
ncbi:MAG: NDP-sugar synthase [Actinomycetota bacterium]|nr:NDP-sugar synthase [Actinomycetota bacterium]